jgi:hypothetical protein
MHRTTELFWRRYRSLPPNVRESARKAFALLKSNPRHPSLQFKRVGVLWSARVDLAYRALAVEDEGDYVWVWIGSHDDYDRILKSH